MVSSDSVVRAVAWRTCAATVAAFMALAAYVQKNDPDAALWMPKKLHKATMKGYPRITQKLIDRFGRNLVDTLGVGQGQIDSILVKIRAAYVCPSLLSLMVAIFPSSTGHHAWRSLAGFHGSVCLLGAALIGIHMYMAGHPIALLQEEQGRELGGLLLVVLWLALCQSSHDHPGGGDVHLVLAGIFAVLPILAWCYVHYNKSIQAGAPAHCKHSL